jgi:isopenicillin N synthase-like dioxygenase
MEHGMSLPIVNIRPLVDGQGDVNEVATEIDRACRDFGFFYVMEHSLCPDLIARLDHLSRVFFALPQVEKDRISMAKGGRAWRGYFRVGTELTSGLPDQKEGLYFGQQIEPDHPLVQAGVPMHGPNLFPKIPNELRETVLEYMSQVTLLGHCLMRGIALALGIDADYFEKNGTADPLVLFRIFHYPSVADPELWGVGEHTDYGLLTILLQDSVGGLEVKTSRGWIAAPPIPGSFVCNIGDMLDRMTRGVYRSTPHRVKNTTGASRLSFPLFFDPNYFWKVKAIELPNSSIATDDSNERWDRVNVHLFEGTYGEYVLGKVSKVFPQLRSTVL